jgi:hypothetical protein
VTMDSSVFNEFCAKLRNKDTELTIEAFRRFARKPDTDLYVVTQSWLNEFYGVLRDCKARDSVQEKE